LRFRPFSFPIIYRNARREVLSCLKLGVGWEAVAKTTRSCNSPYNLCTLCILCNILCLFNFFILFYFYLFNSFFSLVVRYLLFPFFWFFFLFFYFPSSFACILFDLPACLPLSTSSSAATRFSPFTPNHKLFVT